MMNYEKELARMLSVSGLYSNLVRSALESEKINSISKDQYEKLECHSSIKTSVTDRDMLKIQIDHALDTGNKDLFLQLSQELKETSLSGIES